MLAIVTFKWYLNKRIFNVAKLLFVLKLCTQIILGILKALQIK